MKSEQSCEGFGSTVVVIGGGIAGISCVEALFSDYKNDQHEGIKIDRIILISEDRLVKKVTNYQVTGRQIESFDVVGGVDIDELKALCPDGLKFASYVGSVKQVDSGKKIIRYSDNVTKDPLKTLPYDLLCICCGSKPKTIPIADDQREILERVVVIRDTSTVNDLKQRLHNCRKLAILGNGGISLEIVSKTRSCDRIWLIRDESIGSNYFDPGAAKFLLDAIAKCSRPVESVDHKFCRTFASTGEKAKSTFGPSLGPSWAGDLGLGIEGSILDKLEIIHNDQVKKIQKSNNQDYPISIETTGAREFNCDLIVVAIGVEPNNLEFLGDQPDRNPRDGGILIDDQMRTSLSGIYAAGDVVSCANWQKSELWFQMRLWTQARQMGYFVGRCIRCHSLGDDPSIYFNFDCFTHCTTFFGYKLVLLGRYNCQSLDAQHENLEILVRVNAEKDYVKVVIKDNRIIGAVLVGDSGLEETIENLIHDRIDISNYKDQLLDGTVDIEDYFD